MDNYRVDQYNISKPRVVTNHLIQGAFRYQKLNLSTANKLRLKKVSVKQTVHTTPLTELPKAFECSNDDLTRIWYTGARTAQLTEIPKTPFRTFGKSLIKVLFSRVRHRKLSVVLKRLSYSAMRLTLKSSPSQENSASRSCRTL